MRWFILFPALILGGCAGDSEARRQAEEAKNVFPEGYKMDIVAFMRTYLNDPTNVRSASLSAPELKTVGPSARFVACVRYNAKGSNGQYVGVKDSLAVFVSGRLDRVVELSRPESGIEEAERNKPLRETCAAAAYQPFPELERLTR
jgi:hypothetical protein